MVSNIQKWRLAGWIGYLGSVLLSAACDAAGPLRVTVRAEHHEIALLEAYPVTVKLENVSHAPLELRGSMFTGEEAGAVVVKRRGDPAIVLRRPAYVGVVSTRTNKTLDPGESQATTFTISCFFHSTREGSIFDKAGRYQLWVVYDDGVITAKSQAISFTVVRPLGAEENALKLVKALEFPVGLYEPDLIPYEQTAEVLAALEEIASVEQSVIYANYARLALAWRHSMAALAAPSQPDRYDLEEELAAAETLLEAIKNKKFTLWKKAEELRKQLREYRARVEKQRE